MGTVKKLVLASLVSSIMVLTFAIGLFPTPASLDVSAQSGGGIDLLDFFSKALGLDKQVSLSSVLITFPENNSTVKVLSNSTAANIPVQAEIDPVDAAAQVTFGIDGSTPTPGTWQGTVTSNTVTQAPYLAQIDLFQLGAGIFGAHEMYGLAQAAKATVSYDVLDVIDFTVQELDASLVDTNGDGILDNPFTQLGPGEIYVGTLGNKHIVIADLDILGSGSKIEGELGSVIVPVVVDGLTYIVQTGSLTEFLAETINGDPVIPAGEQAVLLVEVAPTIDEIAVNAPAPPNAAALAFGAQYVEISIIYTTDGGVGDFFTEVQQLPEALPVRLAIENLAAAPGEPSGAGVWGLSTDIATGTVVTVPAGGEWGKRADSTLDLFNASLQIYLSELSIFGTFESLMSIDSVDPSVGLATGGETVALTGTFPGAGNLATVAQAAAAYTVYFGTPGPSTVASFVLPDLLGSTPVVSATNMYVSAPANNVTANTSVDVWLFDNMAPSDFASLAAGYTYAVTPSATGITPNTGPLAGGDVVTITGINLSTATLVSFGANTAVPTSVTDTSITVTTPAGDAIATVLVTVTTAGGTSANTLQYTYQAVPTISGFTPDTGLTTGGEQVVITGTNLENVLSVSIAGIPASFPEGSKGGAPGTTLTVTTGVAATPAIGPVVVITAGGIASSAPAEFTYEGPITGVPDVTVTGITPSTGWMFGGAIAVVSGSGFLDGDGVPTVTFGSTVANILEATNTELYVQIPASGTPIPLAGDGAFVVDVTVERVDLKSAAILNDAFTYHSYITDAGITTTAAVLTGGVGTIGIKVAGGTDASLSIPSASGTADINVLAMAFNTGSLSAFNTGSIPPAVNGTVAAGSLTFSTHLYEDNPVFNTGTIIINTGSIGTNTGTIPSLVAGQSTLTEITASAIYPPDAPALLSAPLNAVKLTGADIATGQVAAITRKSSAGAPPTALDYATPSATASLDIGSGEFYSSQLLSANVTGDPGTALVNVGYTGLGTMQVFTDTDLTAFFNFDEIVLTLQVIKQGTTVPVDIDGPLVPGDIIVVTSDTGGLGFVASSNIIEVAKGAAPAGLELTVVPGAEDAFTVRLAIPTGATGVNGTVDLNIFLPTDVGTPTFSIVAAIEVATDPEDPTPSILPLILAALAALLLGGDGGGGGGPCFIATAAYGTPMAAEIETLRALRDTYLLDNAIGTALVDTYYRVSPAIADVVAQSPVLAAVVRLLLLPVVMLSNIALASPALTALFAFMGGTLIIGRRRTRNNKA